MKSMSNLIVSRSVKGSPIDNRAKRIVFALCLAFAVTAGHANGADETRTIQVTAKRFEFDPKEIILKRGQPAVFQLTTMDRTHGFSVPAFNIRADISPGKMSEVRVTPAKTGDFEFFCDVFCGSGHENMSGKIKVTD